MPGPQTILDQLTLASNRAADLAIAWHVAIALAIAALILGWRPSRRAAGVALSGPIASASTVAFAVGNWFNGLVLGALAVALILLALRLGRERAERGPLAATAIGTVMIAFAAFYPHFLVGRTPVAYLYAAPTGLIPCPTLSLAIGFALLGGGLGAPSWSIVLGAVGLFYGLFGVARLGVPLDILLVVGAATLLTLSVMARGARAVQARGLARHG